MGSRRFLASLFLVLFAGLAAVSAAFFWETRALLVETRAVEERTRKLLEVRQAELRMQEARLERLRTDRAYVEREIRRVMNYARPEDYIFRFDPAP